MNTNEFSFTCFRGLEAISGYNAAPFATSHAFLSGATQDAGGRK